MIASELPANGMMQVDATGYGRLVIPGSDGAQVSELRITLEAQTAPAPGPEIVLRYQRPAN